MVGSTINSTKILKSTAVEPINKYYNSTYLLSGGLYYYYTVKYYSCTIDKEQSKTTLRDIQ